MSLGEGLAEKDVYEIMFNRQERQGFKSNAEFLNLPGAREWKIDGEDITVSSEYFLAQLEVKLGQQRIVLYSLLHVELVNNIIQVAVLWRSRGTI